MHIELSVGQHNNLIVNLVKMAMYAEMICPSLWFVQRGIIVPEVVWPLAYLIAITKTKGQQVRQIVLNVMRCKNILEKLFVMEKLLSLLLLAYKNISALLESFVREKLGNQVLSLLYKVAQSELSLRKLVRKMNASPVKKDSIVI